MANKNPALPPRSDAFAHRHLGPRDSDIQTMLQTLGADSLDDLMNSVIPEFDASWTMPRTCPRASVRTGNT